MKPTLVMVHGFGASALMQYPIFKPLMKQFRIVAIDLLGFGASSRVNLPEKFVQGQEISDEYQIGWLEAWMKQVTQTKIIPERFYMTAHSYGGYLSSLFCCRNPKRIVALFLNSTIGCEAMKENLKASDVRVSSGSRAPSTDIFFHFWKGWWDSNRTPFDFVRYLPTAVVNSMMNGFIDEDMRDYPTRHKQAVQNYYA